MWDPNNKINEPKIRKELKNVENKLVAIMSLLTV